jgi:hypothetical protein
MDQPHDSISALLHEAAETHHVVYRITDGVDEDWASWYADWLTRLSDLANLLGRGYVRSELTYLLVKLDKDYNEQAPAEKWEDFYARGLLEHFASGAG